MKAVVLSFFALCLFFGTSPVRAGEALPDLPATTVAPNVQELQQTMLQDEKTMAMIRSLQDDPQVQAILNDPALMQAILAGDTATLMASEKFRAVMNNRTVRDIQRQMENH